jgi:RNA-binding protein NOB1
MLDEATQDLAPRSLPDSPVEAQDSTFSTHGSPKKIENLVLDAGPLITQSASSIQQHANYFWTTPGVFSELKDDNVRQQLVIWSDTLKIRHPKEASIKRVTDFSRLTGDYAVLSANDLHIIALAYELECEQNGGDWRLRKYPGEDKTKKELSEQPDAEQPDAEQPDAEQPDAEQPDAEQPDAEQPADAEQPQQAHVKKPRRRGGKKQREKREAQLQKELDETPLSLEAPDASDVAGTDGNADASVNDGNADASVNDGNADAGDAALSEAYQDSDDDGDWITPENLQEELLKDANEQISELLTQRTAANGGPLIKVALSTGDFACQNVSMQMGLNLMNSVLGKQIKRVRNYMYRCHACFRLTPIPKNGQPKHFCPKCGGATLLRCAVSIDRATGKVTPHLKANFQWIKRGEKFSIPSPQLKNQTRREGNGGYQHNKQNRHRDLQNPLLLREDQKEYQQALKNDEWQRRQNDKMLQEWIGGGSADNYMSPFSTVQGIRPLGVRLGRGRYVNLSRGKKK